MKFKIGDEVIVDFTARYTNFQSALDTHKLTYQLQESKHEIELYIYKIAPDFWEEYYLIGLLYDSLYQGVRIRATGQIIESNSEGYIIKNYFTSSRILEYLKKVPPEVITLFEEKG